METNAVGLTITPIMPAEDYLDFCVVEVDFRHLTWQMGGSIALTTLW